MRNLVCALAMTCVALGGCATAPSHPSAATTPASVSATQSFAPVSAESGHYVLDPRHASVVWRIRHQGLAWYTARFSAISGQLDFNADNPAASQLEAHIDAHSVDTGLAGANGQHAFDQEIARALGANSAPDIVIRSTSITRTGDQTGQVLADLALNGQSHPVTLNVTFDGATHDILRGGHSVLGFSATATIDRTQWGVDQWRLFTGADVQIVIEAEFEKS